MSPDARQRYSQEQILFGLRIIINDLWRIERQLDAPTRIDEYFKAEKLWDDLDFQEIIDAIHDYLGLSCSDNEWKLFLQTDLSEDEWNAKVGPKFTFGYLAEFIAERLEAIPMESMIILGKDCATGGAFNAIKTVVQKGYPRILRFAPSTPIRKLFAGRKLVRFWSRLRWMTENQLPPLRSTWLTKLREALIIAIFVLVLGIAVACRLADASPFLHALNLLFVAMIICFIFSCPIINYLDNRLPVGIRTFGDLAKIMAEYPAFTSVK